MRRFVKEFGDYKIKSYVKYQMFDRAQKVKNVIQACERGMISDEQAVQSIAGIDLRYEEEEENERNGEVLC